MAAREPETGPKVAMSAPRAGPAASGSHQPIPVRRIPGATSSVSVSFSSQPPLAPGVSILTQSSCSSPFDEAVSGWISSRGNGEILRAHACSR